jgi:uncharacterized SAM-binding protein YcdF (DUF218 family)
MAARCSKADAIVVLGCRGRQALSRRLDRAIGLLEAGAARLLVLSGRGRGPIAEAELMRRAALARGVPESALLVEPTSRNTFENARETARLLRSRGLQSVLLVSDRTHLPRATALFRLAGLQVTGSAAVPSLSLRRGIGAAIREMAALPWSLVRAVLTHRTEAGCARTSRRPRASDHRSSGTAPGC